MTHTSTEQERAEFIEFLTSKWPKAYTTEKAQHFWDNDHLSALIWKEQAARRAPVVPDELREAAQRAHDWMDSQADSQSKGNHHSFDLFCLRQERDALSDALAAAPQPPEAAQCQPCRTGSPYACTCTFKTDRNSDPSCFEEATLQLPEYVYTLRIRGRLHDHTPALPAFDLEDGYHKLYTEQQVRLLLAAHGIK